MAAEREVLAHHFADLEQQHEAASLGMWIFLATEVMFFSGLFTGYSYYRSLYPQDFIEASRRLNLWFGGINTVVLLTSSFTMVLAVYGAQVQRRRVVTINLALTALLGTAFLVIKGFEYYHDYEEKLVPGLAFQDQEWSNAQHAKLFYLFYYIMTGIHGLHLIIGIGLMALLALGSARGRFTSAYYTPVEIGGLYWHFVDVIWLFLLPLLYLVGER